MTRSVTIELTDTEFALAEYVGAERDNYAITKGYQTRHGIVGHGKSTRGNHILGVMAELAVSRYLAMDWKANVGTIKGTDVGRDVEVRSRRLRDPSQIDGQNIIGRGLLSLGKRDVAKVEKLFVLVHCYASWPNRRLRLMGWSFGREVLKRRWWHHDDAMGTEGVCRLPHDQLAQMDSLRPTLDRIEDDRRRKNLARQLDEYQTRDGRVRRDNPA